MIVELSLNLCWQIPYFSVFQKTSSPLTSSVDSDLVLLISSQKAHSSSSPSSSQWSSSLAASLARPRSQELRRGSSEAGDEESGAASRSAPDRAGGSSPTLSRLSSSLQAQVARSELNVRLPRGTHGNTTLWHSSTNLKYPPACRFACRWTYMQL